MDLNLLLPCRLQTVSCPRISRDRSGWAAVYDETQRAFYYHNLATDETTWVPPTSAEPPPPRAECSSSASASAEASSDIEQPVTSSAKTKGTQDRDTSEEPSVLGKTKKQGSRTRRRRHNGPSSDDGVGRERVSSMKAQRGSRSRGDGDHIAAASIEEKASGGGTTSATEGNGEAPHRDDGVGRGRASSTKAQLGSGSSGDGDHAAVASIEEKASGGRTKSAVEGNGEAPVAATGSAEETIPRYGYNVISSWKGSRSRLMFRASSRRRSSAGLVLSYCVFFVRGKLAVLSKFSIARCFVLALVRAPLVFLTASPEGMDSEEFMADQSRALLQRQAGDGLVAVEGRAFSPLYRPFLDVTGRGRTTCAGMERGDRVSGLARFAAIPLCVQCLFFHSRKQGENSWRHLVCDCERI